MKPAGGWEATSGTSAETDDPFGDGRPTRGHAEVEDETPGTERREDPEVIRERNRESGDRWPGSCYQHALLVI